MISEPKPKHVEFSEVTLISAPPRRKYVHFYGLKHDDDRVLGMEIVRSILRDIYGDAGVFAADLAFARSRTIKMDA
ncbi:MAG: hypothetical protein QXL27_00885 [Candidatus Bathyarchaeia archaeon]